MANGSAATDITAAATDGSYSIQQLFPKVFSIGVVAIRCDAVSGVLLCKSLVEKVLRPCADLSLSCYPDMARQLARAHSSDCAQPIDFSLIAGTKLEMINEIVQIGCV